VDTGNALLRQVISDPDADDPRLAFVDWLQERGDPGDEDRAVFIRAQILLFRKARFVVNPRDATLLANDPDVRRIIQSSSHAMHEVRYGANAVHGLPERVYGVILDVREAAPDRNHVRLFQQLHRLAHEPDVVAARRDEGRVIAEMKTGWDWKGWQNIYPVSERGFVESVSATWDSFEKHAGDILWCPKLRLPCPDTAQPIRKVTLLTPPPEFDLLHPWVCGVVVQVSQYPTPTPVQVLEARFPGVTFRIPDFQRHRVDVLLHPQGGVVDGMEAVERIRQGDAVCADAEGRVRRVDDTSRILLGYAVSDSREELQGLSFARDPRLFRVNRYARVTPVVLPPAPDVDNPTNPE